MEAMQFLKSDYKVIDDGMYWKIIPIEKKVENSIEIDYFTKTENLLKQFASLIKINYTILTGATRKHEVALARQCIIYFLFHTTPFTYKTIASYFSDRDHSTILYSKDVITSVLSISENRFHRDLPAIKKYLELLQLIWEN